MALWVTKCLKRPTNKGRAVVKGKGVNRGVSYGLEISCEYCFIGDDFSIQWLKSKLEAQGCEKLSACTRPVTVEIKLQFLYSCCYQLSPYIICHHFAWKDNLLAANGGQKPYKNNTLATAKRWLRPLNRGGHWIDVSNTYRLFTSREVRIGYNCARGIGTQFRGHSFSWYGPTQAGE